MSDLAIVGMSCLFPKADGLDRYWHAVKAGVDGIGPVPATHWNPADYFDADPKRPDMTYARRGGFLDPVEFSPGQFGIAPNDLEATDTAQLLGLQVAHEALKDAGIATPLAGDGTGPRVSVILGVTGTLELVVPLGARLGHPLWRRALAEAGVPQDQANDVVERIAAGYVPWQENSFPGLLGNVVAGRIANRLNLNGTNCVVDAACASSLSAVHLAALELEAGRSDVVLTGGVDTFNSIFMYMCFSKTPALSASGDAKPFSSDGDGTILGEGIGMVVLKRLADAERDGDRIYAVLKGIGTSSDGKGNAVYAPVAAGQERCLQDAYAAAGVSPATVELVEAHGTGTKVGDATEATALATVYGGAGRDGAWCALGSVKSQIGHTKAAAGAAGLIKAALALHRQVLPPTLKVKQPLEAVAPGLTPFYVNTLARPWLSRADHPRRAGVSAFGFGGSNFHCVLEEYAKSPAPVDVGGDRQLLAFAADTRAALADAVDAAAKDWPATWPAERAKCAASRRAFDAAKAHRLVVVWNRDDANRKALLDDVGAKLRRGEPLPAGAHYGTGAAGKLAMLFPGQGSQAVGMLRELVCAFPVARRALTAADTAFARVAPDRRERLSDLIYPHPAFDAAAKAAQETALRDTAVAQPALAAASLAGLHVLAEYGVAPDAVAGHSFGELTALHAAGRYDAQTLVQLAQARGRLMGDQAGDGGAMLAVHGTVEALEAFLKAEARDLAIANRNGPTQAVLSGATAEIERAERLLGKHQLRGTRLNVAAAFHSPLVADAAEPFRDALGPVPFDPGRVPVYSNTTAAAYPADADAARDLLAGQLARPVRFVEQVEGMYRDGVRTFVEVGPGATLTRLVRGILEGRAATAVALDATAGRSGLADLATLLATLAAAGHPVDVAAWDADAPPAPAAGKPQLTVPICGANYVKPRPQKAVALPGGMAEGEGATRRDPTAGRHREAATLLPPSPPALRGGGAGGEGDSYRRGADGRQWLLTESRRVAPSPPTPPPRKAGGEGGKSVAVASHAQEPPGSRTQEPAMSAPQPPAPPTALGHALQVTQESLHAFQRMQEQTAQLHKQFLDTQETAQRTLQQLVDGQQRLLAGMTGAPMVAPAFVPPPAPVYVPPPAPVYVPPPAPVVQVPPPAPAPLAASSPLTTVLLEVVAEKTGYPVEMLDLDMGLDADLGIDSIKRVEILSALQERMPDAPAVKPEHLGTLHTLRDIVAFLDSSEPAPVVAAPAVAPVAASALQSVLLEVVAEKTGYPVEMLDLDMGLDADLGIDSIKRVEILSALQERMPDAPAVKPEHLGTLHTLRDIVAFLDISAPTPVTAPTAAADEKKNGSLASGGEGGGTARGLDRPPHADANPPPPQPSPPAKPGGEGAEPAPAVIATAGGTLARHLVRAAPLFDGDNRPISRPATGSEIWLVADAEPLADALAAYLTDGHRLRRWTWADAPDTAVSGRLGALVLLAPAEPHADLPVQAFRWLRQAATGLHKTASNGAAVLTVSRLDGQFGFAPGDGTFDPVAGALAGLAKTAGHEWPDVHCKAVDLDPAVPADRAAALVAAELHRAGPPEVGITAAGLWEVGLTDAPLPAGFPPRAFARADVIVVSGGARGVTAEIAVGLARAYRCHLLLLGRNPIPAGEPADVADCGDEAAVKRALIARGGKLSPRDVDAQCKAAMAGREIRQTLARIQKAGGSAHYASVDVRDADQVAAAVAEAREMWGHPITGVVHGAGVLADRRIEDKTVTQFEAVYGTKVDGLHALLAATESDPLTLIALFSSSTARFGRLGQADYAAANEVLNKTAQREARRRPAVRVVALNWGPWAGGMVTPGLEKLFASEGVGLIPLRAGADHLLAELAAADRAAEVVVLGPPPAGPGPAAPRSVDDLRPPMHLAFERPFDANHLPVVQDHVIDGRPVMPLALSLEWLAHAAIHDHPGFQFAGVTGLRVLHPVAAPGGQTLLVRAYAGKAVKDGGEHRVAVELRGVRPEGREQPLVRADVVLTSTLPTAPPALPLPPLAAYATSIDDVYAELLFHGPELRGIESVEGCGPAGIEVVARTAPPPAAWLQEPLRGRWLADPLTLDCAFQAMILWCRQERGAGSLPMAAAAYRQYVRQFPAGEVRVRCRVRVGAGAVVKADVDFLGGAGETLARIEGYECVADAGLERAFRRRTLEVSAP